MIETLPAQAGRSLAILANDETNVLNEGWGRDNLGTLDLTNITALTE